MANNVISANNVILAILNVIRNPLMSRRQGHLFVTAATEYYKKQKHITITGEQYKKISNTIKKGRNRHIYIFT